MNKGQQFWLDMWQEGRTAFHKDVVNPDLIAFWPTLNIKPGATVLVPLCGKSLDILWLVQQGFNVIGVELSEQAVQQFAQEHQLDFQLESQGSIQHYFTKTMSIWVGDIFALTSSFISPVDAIYDRAALIALPEKLRAVYVERCLQWLKVKGIILLKTLAYNQAEMSGPPYSVAPEEIAQLYQSSATIKCLQTGDNVRNANDPLFTRGLNRAIDSVWCITKE